MAGKRTDLRRKKRPCEDEHQHHSDELDRLRQRLVLNLRQRLYETDTNTDDDRNTECRRGDEKHRHQRLIHLVEKDLLPHR